MGILKTKDYETFMVDETTFVGAANANHALPGDTVEMKDGLQIISRSKHVLVGIIEMAKSRYGFTSRNVPIYLFRPWDESYPPFYVGSKYSNTTNVLAVVDFDSWAEEANCPRGVCRRIFGVCGDMKAEEEALVVHTHPVRWAPMDMVPFQGGSYLDATTFHIDPPGCVDIDDAISLWMNGLTVELHIHIADVASILKSDLWMAEKLGETLYKDGAIVSPMFPEGVQKACSLTPGHKRATLTLAIQWDTTTKTMTKRWIQEDIIVKESYTYESIVGSVWAGPLQIITSEIAKRPVTDPHEWISELMLFYNREAAKILREAGKGILRRHSEPDQELLKRLEGIAPFLAFKAGEYCSPTDANTVHWGLKEDVYCHASSPIRRWVDCINQSVLIQTLFVPDFIVPSYNIDKVNKQAKRVKAFERDLFFAEMLLLKPRQIVEGHAFGEKAWVPAWNRCVSLKGEGLVKIAVYMDPSKVNWKRRLVLEIVESE